MREGEATGGDGQAADDAPRTPPPDLQESVREVRDAGRAALGAGRSAAKALRILVSADISLARSAFGRTLALTGVAIAFGGSAWLLLMAALITFLSRHTGLDWAAALLLTALLSAAVTGAAVWLAMHYFEYTRMQATRRQLARLGIGELAGLVAEAGSGTSSEDSANNLARSMADKPPRKGMGVDVTLP